MARIKCSLIKSVKLKEGDITGMLTFPKGTNRHALLEMEEGEVFLTNEGNTPDEGKVALLKDIREQLTRINDYVEKQEERRDEDE